MRSDGSPRPGSEALAALRTWLRPEDDPYAAVDLGNASRIGALLAILVSFIELVGLLLGGPDGALATVASVVLVALPALGGAAILAADHRLDPTRLLLLPWAGALQVAAIALLAQDRLIARVVVFWLLFAAAVHPLRRLLTLLIGTAVLAVLLLRGEESTQALVIDLLIAGGLTVAAYVLLHALRFQRVALRDDRARALALSQRDPLTGLGNRRALEEALERETARSHRSGSPFAVSVIDVDGFKVINDRFGHLEGDRCLVEVARTIENSVRLPDACFRWGGDEFVVLLPDAGRDGALQLLDRLQAQLHDAARTPDGLPVHASAAVASSDDASPSEVLDAADRALLARKQAVPGEPSVGTSQAHG